MVEQIRTERARYTKAGTRGRDKTLKARENEAHGVSIAGGAAPSATITAKEALMRNQHSQHTYTQQETIEVSDGDDDESFRYAGSILMCE